MLKAAEVATLLGLSPRTVYSLADAGLLPCFRLGVGRGKILFERSAVEAYKASCRRGPVLPKPIALPPRPEPPPQAKPPTRHRPSFDPSMLPPRVIREMHRLHKRCVEFGIDSPLRLTQAELDAAFNRYRNQRMAKWADRSKVRAFYAEAKRLTEATGVPHHVDHIIPLLGEFVCGLHVHTNLQVLPGPDNIRKGNRC